MNDEGSANFWSVSVVVAKREVPVICCKSSFVEVRLVVERRLATRTHGM